MASIFSAVQPARRRRRRSRSRTSGTGPSKNTGRSGPSRTGDSD